MTELLGTATYSCSNYLRTTFVGFIKWLYTNLDFTSNYRYNTNKKSTKVHITSAYPEPDKRYPSITVTNISSNTQPMFIGDLGSEEIVTTTGNSSTGEYIVRLSITGLHDIEIRVTDCNLDTAEDITDQLLFLFRIKSMRDKFTKTYGGFIDPTDIIRSSAPMVTPMVGTNINEYSYILSLRVFFQGDLELPSQEIDIINSDPIIESLKV